VGEILSPLLRSGDRAPGRGGDATHNKSHAWIEVEAEALMEDLNLRIGSDMPLALR